MAEASSEAVVEVDHSFPDDEGIRAWSVDRAISLVTGGRGLLGRDDKVENDDVQAVLDAAKRFADFIQGQ